MSITQLTPDQLRRRCDPDQFAFQTTAELAPSNGIIGQPRGVRAIEFGISIRSRGYNIYVLGEVGTGRTTAIRRYLEDRTRTQPTPNDWVYVHNFRNPYRPRGIAFPAGQGAQFMKEMEQLLLDLQGAVARAFNTQQYQEEVDAVHGRVELSQNLLMRELERRAKASNFALLQVAAGLTVAALHNGEVMTDAQYAALSEQEQERLDNLQQDLEAALEETLKRMRQADDTAQRELAALDRTVAERAFNYHMDALRGRYQDQSAVTAYLAEVYRDVLENLADFRPPAHEGNGSAPVPPDLRRYAVNLFIDNSQTQGAPVVVETNPSYGHLMGRIEYDLRDGMMSTHFTNIKAGSLHRANGGYLVLEAAELLREPYAWDALKRSLKAGQITLQPLSALDSSITPPAKSLDPEPIPLDVKIILLGSPDLYYHLYEGEEDFAELFKVKADFSTEMRRTAENELAYAQFIATRCNEYGLPHFDRSAVARVVEFGSELCGHQKRLSARFGEVGDLVLEACYWASQRNHAVVTAEDVGEALRERIYRANKVETLIDEDIEDGTILLTTQGQVAGQVNGLSVIDMGDYAFGRPSRITARAYMGGGGVVHIERETDMDDPIHNKGVLTIVGFLGGHYAQEFPLSLSASITFEQNYAGVGGDSASLAELLALISSIADRPLRQDVAVTGSINQRGDVQPVGGVSEKVEGFFRVCRQLDLTGTQGVIIPRTNQDELMLHQDVVEAVSAGRFTVWAVDHIDDAIALLFGLPAGVRDESGRYPADSLHGQTQMRLARMAKKDGHAHDDDDEDED